MNQERTGKLAWEICHEVDVLDRRNAKSELGATVLIGHRKITLADDVHPYK